MDLRMVGVCVMYAAHIDEMPSHQALRVALSIIVIVTWPFFAFYYLLIRDGIKPGQGR